MQTSTHGVSNGETEVRKEFVAGHEAQDDLGECRNPAYELADHVEHLAGRLPPGAYDVGALAEAVGLDTEARDRMTAYRTRRGRPRTRPRISWLSWATTRLPCRRGATPGATLDI